MGTDIIHQILFFDFEDKQIFRAVPNLHQRSSNYDGVSSFGMLPPPSLKMKAVESTFMNTKNITANVDIVPSLPLFYHLEPTNFQTSHDSKLLTDLIRKFLLIQEIHFQLKPNKCKFKCTDRMGNYFVIRLFRDENGLIITEVQNRSGCSLRFRSIYNSLKTELTSSSSNSLNQTCLQLCFPNNEELTQTTEMANESKLIEIRNSFNSKFYDTQEITLGQLISELSSLNNDRTNPNYILILKDIEIKLHQMILDYHQMKLTNQLNQIIMSLNLLYDTLCVNNQSVNYNQTIEILTDIICSVTQSTFLCLSIASLIEKFVVICPNVLAQNQIQKKLRLSIAKQSTRDTFQNSIGNYRTQINKIIQSIPV